MRRTKEAHCFLLLLPLLLHPAQWELIAGPDLLELLNEAHGRMNEPAAAFYFVQLLRGVLHMHAMGYCHRDIKPENCMVERATQRLKVRTFAWCLTQTSC